MRHPTVLVFVAAILTCAIAQAGDVYKYVDERGQTMYTDKQASQNSQLANSNQHIAEQQNDSRIAANVAKDLAASRAERCKKARADYQTTINSRRLYRE